MFTPANDIEKAMVAAAADRTKRDAFYKAFLEGQIFYSPQGARPADGSLGKIAVATQPGAEPAAALFTSERHLREVLGQKVESASMLGFDLLRYVRGKPVRVNPNLDYFTHWSAAEVEAILAASLRLTPRPRAIISEDPSE